MIRKLTSSALVCRKVSFILLVSRICPVSSSIVAASRMSSSVGRDIYVPPDVDQLTADAKRWYLEGVANARKDLDSFEKIAENIKDGKDFNQQLKSQLTELLGPVSDANENTKVLVPRLSTLVDSLYCWAQPPITFWSKMKLKSTLWYIQGKRDNKSYYLQNGGGLWCKLRVDDYLQPIQGYPQARSLARDLNGFKEDILYARDMLDDAAQVYVVGINKLGDLVGDIGQNEAEIWKTVQGLKKNGDQASPVILKSAQDAVDKIKTKIDSL